MPESLVSKASASKEVRPIKYVWDTARHLSHASCRYESRKKMPSFADISDIVQFRTRRYQSRGDTMRIAFDGMCHSIVRRVGADQRGAMFKHGVLLSEKKDLTEMRGQRTACHGCARLVRRVFILDETRQTAAQEGPSNANGGDTRSSA